MKFSINWNITRRCNLRCRHCYFEAGEPQASELSTEEALAVVDEIAKTFGGDGRSGGGDEGDEGAEGGEVGGDACGGGVRVTFGGGEPLLREDLFEILAYGKERGLSMSLATNGTLLNEETAYKLRACGVSEVIIPIDGTKRTHEWLRGKNSFERAVRAAKACRKAGLRLVIDPCILRENEAELTQILDIAERLGASQVRIFHFIALGRGIGTKENELSFEEYAANLQRIYEEQVRRRGIEICTTQACQYWVILRRKASEGAFVPDFFWNETPGCRAGISMLSIKPNGNVVPCPLLEISVGNVREKSLRSILKSEILSALRRRAVKGRCSICKHREICGGCRARAFVKSGDFLAEDPLCGDFFFEKG